MESWTLVHHVREPHNEETSM
nr:hypothetical protein [Tanacetum cinerariifolium]